MYDIIVVGGGPAGMTAALYALRNGKRVLVLEKNGFGGQIAYSPKVENYPGSLQLSGSELATDGPKAKLAFVPLLEKNMEKVNRAILNVAQREGAEA